MGRRGIANCELKIAKCKLEEQIMAPAILLSVCICVHLRLNMSSHFSAISASLFELSVDRGEEDLATEWGTDAHRWDGGDIAN
jgi:hypothetical protein